MGIGKKGFTLVEIIVSLAIMTIVAGAVGAFVIAGNNSYMRGNKELTLQEEAQLTANQMIDLIIDVEKGISFSNLTAFKSLLFKEFDKFVNSVNKGAIFFLKAVNLSFVRPPFTCNSNGELASPVIFTVSPGSR